MKVLAAALALLVAADAPTDWMRRPKNELVPLPGEVDLTEALYKLREVKKRKPARLQPKEIALLETLAAHWHPGLNEGARAVLRKYGVEHSNWAPRVCPSERSLEGWTRVPSHGGPKDGCPHSPGDTHDVVYAIDRETCVESANSGEWGSVLAVLVKGSPVWTLSNSLLSPAELVPAKSGYWIIESLEHLEGSGAVSFLSRDRDGKWKFERRENLFNSVTAYRVVGDRLQVAILERDASEGRCNGKKGYWVLSLGENGPARLESE